MANLNALAIDIINFLRDDDDTVAQIRDALCDGEVLAALEERMGATTPDIEDAYGMLDNIEDWAEFEALCAAPKNTHGGAREGAGRPLSGNKTVNIRITPEEHELLMQAGGSEFIKNILADVEVEYEVRDAYDCGHGIHDDLLDCYRDSFKIHASSDKEAWERAERVQEDDDNQAQELMDSGDYRDSDYENAPCYTANLWKIVSYDGDVLLEKKVEL